LRLLELGADPNASGDGNMTPLQMAMRSQNLNAILPLLTHARTDLAPLSFVASAGEHPTCEEWPLLFVFCVLFAFAKQLSEPKDGSDEAALKQLLSSEPALREAVHAALLLQTQPSLVQSLNQTGGAQSQ
jgi:hypothetical protein